MNPNTKKWLHGLVAAFIGGMAGAVDSGLALMVLDPQQFNLGQQLARTLTTSLVLGALVGAKCSFAYLKQSPLPSESVEVTHTETVTLTKDAGN